MDILLRLMFGQFFSRLLKMPRSFVEWFLISSSSAICCQSLLLHAARPRLQLSTYVSASQWADNIRFQWLIEKLLRGGMQCDACRQTCACIKQHCLFTPSAPSCMLSNGCLSHSPATEVRRDKEGERVEVTGDGYNSWDSATSNRKDSHYLSFS